MPHRADADPGEVVDLDDGHLDQSDQPDHLDDGPSTRGRLPRWARSRWAAPAAVTAVVLLLGVAGLQQARATASAEVVELRRMTSVQLGSATFFFSGAPQADGPGADGHLEQQVQVGVRNTGDEDLRITPVSTTVQHARVVPGAKELFLRAGRGGGMSFLLEVDCSAVRSPTDAYSRGETPPLATDVLRLAVTVDSGDDGGDDSGDGGGGRTAERDYLLPDSGWGGLGEQLAYACSPDAYGQAVSVSTEEDADGRLVVELFNGSDEPVAVQLLATAGLRVAAQPALPAEVPVTSSLEVVLALDPDCGSVSDEERRTPNGLDVNVGTTAEDGSALPLLDSTATAVWVARQVALRCG